jgi:hypothetical protein
MSWYRSSLVNLTGAMSALSNAIMPKSGVSDVRQQWASIRRYFQMLDQADGDGDAVKSAALKEQIPELVAKFAVIKTLLDDERRLYKRDGGSRDVRAAVFSAPEDDVSVFVHACTFAKSAEWPELRAAVMKALVELIFAADEFDGLVLAQQMEMEAFVDVLGGARGMCGHPQIEEALAAMVELLTSSATSNPAVLSMIRPNRVRMNSFEGGHAITFMISLTTQIIDSSASAESLRRALDAFVFLLLACQDLIQDSTVDGVVTSVTKRMGQQLVTVCALREEGHDSMLAMFLHAVRFLNFLVLGAPHLVPIVRRSLSDIADRLAQMLTSPNDEIFQSAVGCLLAAARSSSQVVVRRFFGLVLLRDNVLKSVLPRFFDASEQVAPSAIIALAGAFEYVPREAFGQLLTDAQNSGEAAEEPFAEDFPSATAIDDAYSDFIVRSRNVTAEPSFPPARVTLAQASPALIRSATVVKTLCERLATAYTQPSNITAACLLLSTSILALPSADVWTALLVASSSSPTKSGARRGPLASVLNELSHWSVPVDGTDSKAKKRQREQQQIEGMVKGLLREHFSEVHALREAHLRTAVPMALAQLP